MKRAAVSILIMTNCLFCFADFVTVSGTKFFLNDERFRFLGANCYYMHYSSNEVIDDLLTSAKQMGLSVLRIWGFLDGEAQCKDKKTYLHPSVGVFGLSEGLTGMKDGFERLDYIVHKAKVLQIKLIVVLVNNWDDFGGMNQYVTWFKGKSHDDFYTDEKIKEEYKKYVNHLLNRVNIYTGITYKDEPTIMAWELANEPRCESDKSGGKLAGWVKEMSAFIKSVDKNHLVSVGDEGFFNVSSHLQSYGGFASWTYSGFSGVDWEKLLEVQSVDFATFHLYPTQWGVPEREILSYGLKWIEDHIKVAKSFSKPIVLEEFGVHKSVRERAQIYKLWLDRFYDLDGDGAIFWMIAAKGEGKDIDSDGCFPDYDGFRILNDSTFEAELFRETAKAVGGSLN